MKKPFAIAIMAAGKGTRLHSQRAKVLHEIGGLTLLEHVVRTSQSLAASKDIFAIIGHQADAVRERLAYTGIKFILQKEQRGTGHAIQCAAAELNDYERVLVLSGDAPLITVHTLQGLREFHERLHAAMTILTAIPPDTAEYGRVIRTGAKSPTVNAIVEKKMLNKVQSKVREINSGIYCFDVKPLMENIDRLTRTNVHGEYYLTDIASLLVKAKKRVVALPAADYHEVLGANTLAEMAELDATMRLRKCHALMAKGVSIQRPDTCVIDVQAEVAADTVIEPFVQLLGTTKIGASCRIRSYSVLQNSTIADNVRIRNGCILDEAKVASGAILGPYAHLRPGSEIGENAHVGNFVETKKVKLGKGSKANHLTYLGDAEIGERVNIGAGTITCNYDGVNKHTTTIADGVFVGSDSTLVAPITVGEGAYVGAGSCITDDVPAYALALGRGRQVVIENWAKDKKPQKKS